MGLGDDEIVKSEDNEKDFPHGDLTYMIIGAAMEVHRELGPGFLESVYHEALAREFKLRGISFEDEKQLAIEYKGAQLKKKFRVDFICDNAVLVEIEALSAFDRAHEAKTISYLKAGKIYQVGLLINFGTAKLEWKRYIHSPS